MHNSTRGNRARILCAAGLFTIGLATAAQAQDTAQADATATRGNLGGDIIVTAQRRPERLQDVPVAVTAFNEETIRNLNLNDAIKTAQLVPGMIATHNAGLGTANAYYLRGLGNSQSVATFDPPVGTYVDNVYVARQNANNYQFFDVDRVEVLRGPQGTLFGRNTTGGAVSVIMKKPSDTMGAKFEGTYGSFDRTTAKTSIDIPLSEQILTKWSAYYVYDEGYLRNVRTGDRLNGERNYGFRGDLRFLPTDDLTIDLSGEYTRNTGTYLGVYAAPVPSSRYKTTTTPDFYNTRNALPKGDCNGDPVNILLTTVTGNCALTDSYAATADVNWQTDAGNLELIAGYRKQDQGYINNYNGTTANVYAAYILADKVKNNQVSTELKWTGEALDDKLKYVAGVFYLREVNRLASADFQGATTATSFNLLQDRHFRQEVETVAGYLQGDYEVVPDLTLTVGARYTYEKKTIEYFDSERFPGFGFNSADVRAAGIPLKLTQKRVTPRFAINYKLSPSVMLYASATNGFKSGGWNGNAAVATRVLAFKPEVTWSYEGGIKSELFDRKVRINLNGYYARTKNLQITSGIVPPGETVIVSLARNAGTLVDYGLEFETVFAPVRNFEFFANGSLSKGKYSSVVILPNVSQALQISTDTRPVRTPTFQFTGGATYTIPVDALDGDIKLIGAYRHNSSYYVAVLNTAAAPREDFVDLKVAYEQSGGTFGASFGVTNLTKQETITANFLSLFPGDPRRFTGSVWFKF